MNKIQEIFTAWKTSFNPDQAQKELAHLRNEICQSCEHKQTIAFDRCGLCGCPLHGKVHSPVQNACPAGKWGEVDKNYFENRHRHNTQQK
jgi:hypothetical protein